MKKDIKIPFNYQTVMPYLVVRDAQGFMDFTKAVFDAVETSVVKDENRVVHAEIMIGECTVMFADATEDFASQGAGLFVYVDNADERFNKAIEAGAVVVSELGDQSYGRSGGVRDAFGNTWWITSI